MTKVLLVEDDNNLREIYEARLTAEGYEISSAQDGEEALVVAKQTKPDLVISDVMMPKISGFEMLDILRNTPGLEHVKVIMLTALGQSEDRERADSLGANKYLVKSQVTLEDIVKTARQMLGDEESAATAPEAAEPSAAATVSATVEPAPAAPTEPVATESMPLAEPPAEGEPLEQSTPVADTAAETPPNTQQTPIEKPDTPPSEQSTSSTQDNDKTVAAVVEPEPSVTSVSTSEPVVQSEVETSTAPQSSESATTTPQPPVESAEGSAAQEEALVKQQIENFVEQIAASETAPTPTTDSTAAAAEPVVTGETTPAKPTSAATVAPTPEPAGVSLANPTNENTPIEPAPAVNDAAVSTPDEVSAADDQLMAEAVDQLAGITTENAVEEGTAQPSQVIAPDTAPTSQPVSSEAVEDTSTKANISIAGKKVIQPLGSEPKPDINELLAREEATSTTEAPVTSPVISSEPTAEPKPTEEAPAVVHQPGQSFAPQPESTEETTPTTDSEAPAVLDKKDDFDPNSIAL